MRIAVITSSTRGEIDRLISAAAADLQARGVRLSGIVKVEDGAAEADCACDMAVRVLPEGEVIPITQDLGQGSNACRLDPAAIARAVALVEAQPLDGVQMFVLNKFGPEEAQGRGFCNAIAAALAENIPVLVGVGASNRAAFDDFADNLAEELPPEAGAIRDWCAQALAGA